MKTFQGLLLISLFLISCQKNNQKPEKDFIILEIQNLVGVTFEETQKDYYDPAAQSKIASKYYFAEFDHAKITDNTKLIYAFIDTFKENKFEENINYTADGPTGSSMAYSNKEKTYVIFLEWAPPTGAEIPDDEPLDLSKFNPEEIVYSIEIFSYDNKN